MKQEGVVKSVSGELCEVVIRRKTACGDNCASCGACRMKFQSVMAKNQPGAESGDYVTIETDSKKVLFSAFLVYILPISVFIISFLTAQKMSARGSIVLIVSLGLTAVASGFAIFFDRRHKDDFLPIVTEIEQKG